MDMIPSGIWILLNISAVIALISAIFAVMSGSGKLSLWRESLRWDGLSALLIPLGILVLAICMMWGLPEGSGISLGVAAGAILPWTANRICASRPLLMMITLIMTMLVTMPMTSAPIIAGVIVGTLLGHLAEISHQQHDNPETHTPWGVFLPVQVWLTGLLWIRVTNVPEPLLPILVTAVALLLLITAFEIQWSRITVFRSIPNLSRTITYTLIGFTGMYLVIQHVLLAPSLTIWACMFALGILSAGLLRGLFQEESYQKPDLAKLLVLMAILGLDALVPSRLIGTLGWMVTAMGMLTGIASLGLMMVNRYIKLGVLFLLARTLLQVFVSQYNPNVTGINITHTYASAGLFLGMVPMLIYPLVLDVWPKKVRSLMLLCIAILVPMAINYFLHAEAAGSFFVGSTFGALAVALFSPHLSEVHPRYANQLLPKACLMISMAFLAGPLITLGNTADKTEQMIALGVIVLLFVTLVLFLKKRIRPVASTATSAG